MEIFRKFFYFYFDFTRRQPGLFERCVEIPERVCLSNRHLNKNQSNQSDLMYWKYMQGNQIKIKELFDDNCLINLRLYNQSFNSGVDFIFNFFFFFLVFGVK